MATPRLRQSEAPAELRASVLDAALNLGIRNSVMAKWMFDPIQESEDGDELSSSPGLTSPSLSESTTSYSASDDPSMAPFHFRFQGRFGAASLDPKLDKIHEQPSIIDADERAPEAISVDHSTFLPASQSTEDGHSMSSSTKEKRKKLRKLQKSGYESDGGYVSESGKKTKRGTKEKKNKGDGIGYESDGGYLGLKISTKSRSKSKKASEDTDVMLPTNDAEAFLAAVNATLHVPIAQPDGYLTDHGSNTTPSKRGRTKTKKEKGNRTSTSPAPPLGTDESTSAPAVPDTPSKKNRLLRMMTRSTSRDRDKDKDKAKQADEVPPPVPPLPVSLPIAERFARTGLIAAANALPASSGTSTGTSSVTPELSRTYSGEVPPSREAIPSLTTSPITVATTTSLSSELWNYDALLPSGAKPSVVLEDARITIGRDDETSAQPITRSQSQDAPVEKAKAATSFRSFSPVFSNPINALLSTPEKRRKKKENAASPGGSVSSNEMMSSANSAGSSRPPLRVTTAAISQPNPYLSQRLRPPLSPLEIASRMRSDSPGQGMLLGLPPSPAKLSPGYVRPAAPSPSAEMSRTPDSYVFVEKEDEEKAELAPERKIMGRQSMLSVIPSSDYIVPSPMPSPLPSGLASRRAMTVAPLSSTPLLNIAPGKSRSNTPIPASPNAAPDEGLSIPNTPTARASVIAYYQVPPPSPPPTGPLPRVPDVDQIPRRGSDDRQFLSPAAAARYSSRSPSPLRMATSRPTSPSGLFNQAIPPVRRGRESPFPTRPILPAEDRGTLVRRPSLTPKNIRPDAPLGVTRAVSPDLLEARMQRFRNTYAAPYQDDDADAEEFQNDVYSSSEDFHEATRSSAYIREARARGEKRVYFSDQTISASEEEIDVRLAVHALRQNDSALEEEGEDDNYSRYTKEEDDGSFDRRSLASMSVYSRYSMLDADRSAELREGFVKRVEALYGKDGWDDIPAVPEIPASLRGAAPRMAIRNASSPSRF